MQPGEFKRRTSGSFSATCGRQHTNNMWTAPFVSLQVNKDTKISCVITTLRYKQAYCCSSWCSRFSIEPTNLLRTANDRISKHWHPPPPCGCHRDLCVRNQIYIEEALFFSWHCQFYKLNYQQQKSTKIDIGYYVICSHGMLQPGYCPEIYFEPRDHKLII